jgi:spore maturation protein CgeB
VKIFVIGSSITSCYWNGAATYYRGIYKQLARLEHEITFAEPDVYGRQQHRDSADTSYVLSVVYQSPNETLDVLRSARGCDLVIKHSGVGAEDQLLEAEVLKLRGENTRVVFWDVDAPATLARVDANPADPFRKLIRQYDHIFTYGGGEPVVQHYVALGAKDCQPIYNALDPDTHHPVPAADEFRCDLAFVGNRLPDREARVEQFFLRAAELAPQMTFLLGGEGWGSKVLPANVRYIGHVPTGLHNVINCSARMVLNINRESMADVGFSPPTRVFEAAGAGACLVTDHWTGVEQFFEIGKEILVARTAEDIVGFLRTTSASSARETGEAMRERALRDHTYELRAQQVQQILQPAAEEAVAR